MAQSPFLFANCGRKLYPKDNLSGDVKLFSNTGNLLKEAMQYAHQMSGNYYVYKSCYLFNIVYDEDLSMGISSDLLAFTTPLFMPHRSTEVPGESNVSYRKDDYPKGSKTVVDILETLKVDGILEEVVKARSKHGNTSVDGLIKQFERYLFINNGKKLSTAEETVTIGDILDHILNIERIDTNIEKSISISCTKNDESELIWQITDKKESGYSKTEENIFFLMNESINPIFLNKSDPKKDILPRHISDVSSLIENLWNYIRKLIMPKVQDDLSDMDDSAFKLFLDDLFARVKTMFDLIVINSMLRTGSDVTNNNKSEVFSHIDEDEYGNVYRGSGTRTTDIIYFYLCRNIFQANEDTTQFDKNLEHSRNIYYHFVRVHETETCPDYLKELEKDTIPEVVKRRRTWGKKEFLLFIVLPLLGIANVLALIWYIIFRVKQYRNHYRSGRMPLGSINIARRISSRGDRLI